MAKYIKLNFLKPQPITAPITADPRNIDIPVSWSPAASMEKSNVIVKRFTNRTAKPMKIFTPEQKTSKNLDVYSQVRLITDVRHSRVWYEIEENS